ncbi:hypothetical protein Dimus_015034 [Dionaea muscipula]
MKKKRLQIQARNAGVNYYLPALNNQYHHVVNRSTDSTCWYNGSSFYEESGIRFGQEMSYHEAAESNWYALPSHNPLEQFTLTHASRATDQRQLPINIMVNPPSLSSTAKPSGKSLDLELGLSMKYNLRSSPASGI